MTSANIAVRVRGVAKSFGGTRILDNIDVEIAAGTVHALVGENGAGKSSLGKIVGGYYTPDEGQVEILGHTVARFSPRDALQLGVAMIHQELQLAPELNVVQNVFLGRESARAGILVKGDMARFEALERTCDFGIAPLTKVATLRIAERQKVEIMRAIARDAQIIIMDEPTSSLTEDEADRLHEVIKRLKSQGKTIIYVSHFLDHILANCDNVTIMRDDTVAWRGFLGEHEATQRDVIFYAYGYVAHLYWLLSTWNMSWKSATIRTIATPLWPRLQPGISDSPLAWITTGTIEARSPRLAVPPPSRCRPTSSTTSACSTRSRNWWRSRPATRPTCATSRSPIPRPRPRTPTPSTCGRTSRACRPWS